MHSKNDQLAIPCGSGSTPSAIMLAVALAGVLLLVLSGCGVGAAPTSTPTNDGANGILTSSSRSIDFKSVTVGSTASQVLTISNTGSANISISSIGIAGSSFSVSGLSGPVTLRPMQTATANLTFAPSTIGSASGSLKITTDTQGQDLTIALTGTGVSSGTALLNANPSAVTFGTVIVGSSSDQSVTLTNVGGATATISTASYSGPGFTISGLSTPLTLFSGESTTFHVGYAPTSSGTASGSLLLKDGVGTTVLQLSLSATSVTPLSHSVTLAWNPSPSSTVVGYRVYRGTQAGGPYSLLSVSLLTATSYEDTTVRSGNRYLYVVTAVDASNLESPYSNEVVAIIPIP